MYMHKFSRWLFLRPDVSVLKIIVPRKQLTAERHALVLLLLTLLFIPHFALGLFF